MGLSKLFYPEVAPGEIPEARGIPNDVFNTEEKHSDMHVRRDAVAYPANYTLSNY